MKIAYFDCFSGISGDMCLGALADAGVPLETIERELRKLKIRGYELTAKTVKRAGIAATKVDVVLKTGGRRREPEVRRWRDIQAIIRRSSLRQDIKRQGHAIFKALFEAEAKVHGKTINAAHLHELGCVDCLVDVFGTLIGLSVLGIGKIYASPINVGSGTTKTSHGIFPVPAPATGELLKGIPCYSSGPAFERTTPTGAAIIKTLSSGFGEMPCLVPERAGIGAGNKDPEAYPNVLRVMIGEAHQNVGRETVTVIETNIDDMNPQIYEYVIERLFASGAFDVFLTPVIMKKSRPGIVLTVLCSADRKDDLVGIILRETTTIGVRFYEADRVTMKRQIMHVSTEFGRIRVKRSVLGGAVIKTTPEYDDCKRTAVKKKVPLQQVIDGTIASRAPRESKY